MTRLKRFAVELFGAVFVFGVVALGSYGIRLISRLFLESSASSWLTTIIDWLARVTFWLGAAIAFFAVLGAILNLVQGPEARRQV